MLTNTKQASTFFHCKTFPLGNSLIEQNQVDHTVKNVMAILKDFSNFKPFIKHLKPTVMTIMLSFQMLVSAECRASPMTRTRHLIAH